MVVVGGFWFWMGFGYQNDVELPTAAVKMVTAMGGAEHRRRELDLAVLVQGCRSRCTAACQ